MVNLSDDIAVVIQAGGRGKRLREITGDSIPKPLAVMNGKTLIEWQIDALKRYEISEYVIIIGYCGECIREILGDGSAYGIRIQYVEEKKPLGSAGALSIVSALIPNKTILLVFGDVMFDMDLPRMLTFHRARNALITLAMHPNSHPYDSDLLVENEEHCIIKILGKEEERTIYYKNLVNAGISIVEQDALQNISVEQACDFEKDVIRPLLKEGRIYGYKTTEYIKDVGTVERFRIAEEEQKIGKWGKRNQSNKQKCIFLDRDGTINVQKGLVGKPEDLILYPRAVEAIKLFNQSEYLTIVVTNQPVVARGICSIEDVELIHKKLETDLGAAGVYVDDIIFCPHHPDKGYPEENPKYKIVCNCRKPKTGMIDAMVHRYNIDRKESYMIGDTTVDVQTGKNAGLKTILLHSGLAGADGKYDVQADQEAADLYEAAERILKR
ncbi:MAG: HAD-IIIA family hydrolase [Lachnospiraceae bacterium]|nr:HAD-IIIA family hydrolase [Lachnospiraceae bacterium]